MNTLRAARELFESIDADDGIVSTLRVQGAILNELRQVNEAEQLYAEAVRRTAGSATPGELLNLMNLSAVYQQFLPLVDAATSVLDGQEKDDKDDGPLSLTAEYRLSSPADAHGAVGMKVQIPIKGTEGRTFSTLAGGVLLPSLYRAAGGGPPQCRLEVGTRRPFSNRQGLLRPRMR